MRRAVVALLLLLLVAAAAAAAAGAAAPRRTAVPHVWDEGGEPLSLAERGGQPELLGRVLGRPAEELERLEPRQLGRLVRARGLELAGELAELAFSFRARGADELVGIAAEKLRDELDEVPAVVVRFVRALGAQADLYLGSGRDAGVAEGIPPGASDAVRAWSERLRKVGGRAWLAPSGRLMSVADNRSANLALDMVRKHRTAPPKSSPGALAYFRRTLLDLRRQRENKRLGLAHRQPTEYEAALMALASS